MKLKRDRSDELSSDAAVVLDAIDWMLKRDRSDESTAVLLSIECAHTIIDVPGRIRIMNQKTLRFVVLIVVYSTPVWVRADDRKGGAGSQGSPASIAKESASQPATSPADSVSARSPKPNSSGESVRGVVQIQTDHDRALLRDLTEYLVKNPKATDAEQAYMTIFNKAIEHDWFAEHEALARRYLANEPEGPVRPLASIIAVMARAKSGEFAKAYQGYLELMKDLSGADQEEFAANFADSLATSASIAGEYKIARQVYEQLIRKFGESDALVRKVNDDLVRLDRVGKPAPPVIVNDLKGKPFRLDQLKGKYVLVDFWATWCPPCVAETPRLQAAYAKYHDRGFEIVSISLDEAPDVVFDFVQSRKIAWRQIHNATCGGDAVASFGVNDIPSSFLIDPAGTIVRIELRGQALDETLKKLIK